MSRSSYSQKLSSLKAAAMAKIAGVASADDNDGDDIPPPPPPEDTKFAVLVFAFVVPIFTCHF